VGSGGLTYNWGQLVFGQDGNLYVSSFGTNNVLRYDGNTGTFLGAFVAAGSGGLRAPEGLAFGPDGDLYVVSQGTNSVLRYDGTTGAFLGIFAGPGGPLFRATYLTYWDLDAPAPAPRPPVLDPIADRTVPAAQLVDTVPLSAT